MDLTTIDVDRQTARQAVAAYRRALHNEKHDRLRKEDEAILRGYREIARGHPIIAIRDVIHAGGENARLLPKLAISRADEKRVEVRRRRDGSVRFGVDLGFHPSRGVTLLPPGTLSSVGWPRWQSGTNRGGDVAASAIVPTIPPEFRPNAQLERYWILFEAEWQEVAPKDPALLRALGGGLVCRARDVGSHRTRARGARDDEGPMSDEKALDIAPLPPNHQEGPSCPCVPLRSSVAGREVWIHRNPAGEIPMGPPPPWADRPL